MQFMRKRTVSNRNTPEGALLEQPRGRPTPQKVLILCVETRRNHGRLRFQDHNDGNHFLACEIDSRVAARTRTKETR